MGEGDKEWEKLAEFYLVLASEDASKLENMTAISNLCLYIIDNSYANVVKGGGDASKEIRITKRDGSDPEKTIIIESIEGVGLHIRVQDVNNTSDSDGSKIKSSRITEEFVKLFRELGW